MDHPNPEIERALRSQDIVGSIDRLILEIEDGTQAKHYERLLQMVWERDCRVLRQMARDNWRWGSQVLREP